MDSNTHSTQPREHPDGLVILAGVVDELAAQDLDGLSEVARAERVLGLRRLLDRLEGQWLKELAGVDGRGAAGAELDQQPGSTTAWLRHRLHMSAGVAASTVRTARALFRGPLPATAAALCAGELSAAHASVLAHGTHHLPAQVAVEAEAVLLEAAGRLDPPRLRRAIGHLWQVTDPEGAEHRVERQHQRRGLWLAATWDGMAAVDGLLDPEAGQLLAAALEPLARPVDAQDPRSGAQRRADALAELARRALEGGRLPQAGGVRPQLLVTVNLDSLLGHPGGIGGEAGGAGPLAAEGCRRLACDGTVTRVVVTRHPNHHQHPNHHHPGSHHRDQPGDHHSDHHPGHDPDPRAAGPPARAPEGHLADPPGSARPPSNRDRLQGQLRAALALLPPNLGGAPSQPLEVGRATRVIQPAQRTALTVRDGGCVVPDCSRPLAWCEAHHLVHWLHGGPTNLDNLALVCRAHHRAVHEGGWQLARGPDGRFTATPPHRRHPTARRHPTLA